MASKHSRRDLEHPRVSVGDLLQHTLRVPAGTFAGTLPPDKPTHSHTSASTPLNPLHQPQQPASAPVGLHFHIGFPALRPRRTPRLLPVNLCRHQQPQPAQAVGHNDAKLTAGIHMPPTWVLIDTWDNTWGGSRPDQHNWDGTVGVRGDRGRRTQPRNLQHTSFSINQQQLKKETQVPVLLLCERLVEPAAKMAPAALPKVTHVHGRQFATFCHPHPCLWRS